MDTKRLVQVLLSGGPSTERMKSAVELGRAGPAASDALAALRQVVADRSQDILVRGYAAWAVEPIDPRPAAEPGRTFHVDQKHPRADDTADGSRERPWKTIQRAAETLRPGDTVLIHDGLYRECVRPFLGGTGPDRLVTYAAAPGAKPVLTGADEWHLKWKNEGHRFWSAPYERNPWDWPEQWPNPSSEPACRAEQIIIGDQLLVHVGTRDEFEEREDTFYTDDAAGRIFVHMIEDVPPHRMLVERSMRQQVFAPAVRGLGHIRVAGLAVRYGANPEVSGSNWNVISHRALVSTRTGHHWTIEDNTIEWGNAQGLDIGCEGWGDDVKDQPVVTAEPGRHVVRRNVVNHHGLAGIVGWGSPGQCGLLLEDNETSDNCRKGNWQTWEAAGLKLHEAKDCIIRRHRSVGNGAYGIWLDYHCERSRITQCVCIDNRIEGIFFEVSAGPVLIDSNVVIDTRDEPAQGGLYSHDGNRAVYVNNYVRGCRFGVRLRNLFARIDGGRPTTTSHNRIWNNFLVDCADAAVSLNPEVARAEDNRSDSNLLWSSGRPVLARLENTDAGVQWGQTPVGRAMNLSGGGNVTLPLAVWQDAAAEDRGSLVFPPAVLFGDQSPEEILETLADLWPADAPPLDAGYGEVSPRAVTDVIAALRPEFEGGRCVRTLWLAPTVGLQVWETSGGLLGVLWDGSASAEIIPLAEQVMLGAPVPPPAEAAVLAIGETRSVPVLKGGCMAYSGLDAVVGGGGMRLAAPEELAPGQYGVVLVSDTAWQYVPVTLTPPLSVGEVTFTRDGGNTVAVPVTNHTGRAAEATVSLTFGEERTHVRLPLAPRCTATARLVVELAGAGEAQVTVEAFGRTITKSALVSFVAARRGGSWDEAPRFAVDGFPGGAFPEGGAAFERYGGGLSARFAARHDEAGLHLLVEVDDETHQQTRDLEHLPDEDSLQVQAKAVPGLRALEVTVAKHSETGEVIVVRKQAPDGERDPAGRATDVPATVERRGRLTVYEVTLPWAMLGLPAAPAAGAAVRLSLLVNNNDGLGRHGHQWFFGIKDRENEEQAMGTVWIG